MAKTIKITFPHPLVYWRITTYNMTITPVQVYAESDKSYWTQAPGTSSHNSWPEQKRNANLYPSWEEARTALVEMLDRRVRQYEREAAQKQQAADVYKKQMHEVLQMQRPTPLKLVTPPVSTYSRIPS